MVVVHSGVWDLKWSSLEKPSEWNSTLPYSVISFDGLNQKSCSWSFKTKITCPSALLIVIPKRFAPKTNILIWVTYVYTYQPCVLPLNFSIQIVSSIILFIMMCEFKNCIQIGSAWCLVGYLWREVRNCSICHSSTVDVKHKKKFFFRTYKRKKSNIKSTVNEVTISGYFLILLQKKK